MKKHSIFLILGAVLLVLGMTLLIVLYSDNPDLKAFIIMICECISVSGVGFLIAGYVVYKNTKCNDEVYDRKTSDFSVDKRENSAEIKETHLY